MMPSLIIDNHLGMIVLLEPILKKGGVKSGAKNHKSYSKGMMAVVQL